MNVGGIGLWEIAVWCLGTLGVAGIIVLLVIAPSSFGIALRVIIKLLSLVLSYRLGCAVVAAVVVGLAVDYWRHSTDDAEFAQRTALFEHAQTERDERIKTETRDDVWKEIADATAANAVLDNDVKEFTDAPPPVIAPASDPYRIDPVSRAKLCDIAGKTDCRPQGSKRVQAPRRPGASPSNRRLPQGVGAGAGRPAQSKPAHRGT